jgi:hypothetical protein
MGYGGVLNTIVDPFGVGDTGTPNTPRPGKVGQDYLGLINAYAKGAPTVFNTEEQFKPAYNALNLSELSKSIPALTGFLSDNTGKASDIVRNLNPGQANLMDSLTTSANDQLNAGASLDPQLERLFQQSTRGAQAARGMGFGPSDAFKESLGMTEFGNDLRTQREQFATNVAGANSQYETQPALNLLTQLPAEGMALNQASGPSIIPSNQSYDAFNTAYNARAAANIAGANNSAAAANSY